VLKIARHHPYQGGKGGFPWRINEKRPPFFWVAFL